MKIKICGITNIEDAKRAVELGADMIGFVFFKGSKRYIDPASAKEIIKEIPPEITKVGVFVNENLDNLRKIKEIAGFDIFQLHGSETPEFCLKIDDEYIKAFRIKNGKEFSRLDLYNTNFFLFDTYVEKEYGGTGRTFDWKIIADAKLNEKFVILSGGLNPKNVANAVKIAKPNAVDVSSGVERIPGKKDYNKLRKFIKAVRNEQ